MKGGLLVLIKIIEIGHLMKPPEYYLNFAQKVNTEQGVAILIDLDSLSYIGVHVIETPHNSKLLLYCDQKGNVSGKSPTVNLSLKNRNKPEELRQDIEKAFENKLKKFFNHEKLKGIEKILQENSEKIIEDVEKVLNELDAKSAYLTILMVQNNKELKPAEYEPLKEVFVERSLEKALESQEIGTCSFCGELKNVSATVNEVFKFATFDKPGFTPSLKKADAVKVLPICEACKVDLQNGQKIVTEDLSFNFLGNKLWVIPSLLMKNDDILRKVLEKIKQTANELKDFANKEKIIEQALSDEDQIVQYDFLFMSLNQSQQRIELHLAEVSPTRLREIVEASKKVLEKLNIENLPEPNLGSLWNLYEKPSAKSQERKDYMALVRSIFHEQSYSLQRFLWYCMRKIRKTVQNETFNEDYRRLVYLSFASILYLNQIGVFHLKKEEVSMNGDEFSSFFERYPEFFNSPWKKAVFLTGVLAEKVLYLQYQKRKARPFFKKFKGLKMNMKDLQGLLSEIRNKLEQYDGYNPRADLIMKAASKYYLESGNPKVSIDELNFVFTLGLAYRNKETSQDKEVEENEEQI